MANVCKHFSINQILDRMW